MGRKEAVAIGVLSGSGKNQSKSVLFYTRIDDENKIQEDVGIGMCISLENGRYRYGYIDF